MTYLKLSQQLKITTVRFFMGVIIVNLPRSVLCISLGLSLAGCAARPSMTQGQYDSVAASFAGAYMCGVSGKMSSNDALWAKRMLYGSLSNYYYDKDYLIGRVQAAVNSNPTEPTQEQCNMLSMRAVEYQQNVESSNARVQAQQQALINQSRPTNTVCNNIGGQIFCHDY